MVGSWVPDCGGLSGEGEGVGAEHDAQGLDPGEVAGAVVGADADKPGVDVEVGVRDEGEVVVGLAVEVEHYAVAANEAGVVARRPVAFAVWFPGCTRVSVRMHTCIS